MKAEGHLGRCYLKGTAGDAANAILTAVGHNLRLVLAWLRILLRLILIALWHRLPFRAQISLLTADELKGRLGNQMFQYATGYAVAKRSNVPLRIDSLRFIEYNHRAPQLYCLPISAQEASPDEWSCVASEGVELSENGLAFDPRLMERWHHAYLSGWWQSENYFSEFRRDILSIGLKTRLMPTLPSRCTTTSPSL
jgi:hypothetical protein